MAVHAYARGSRAWGAGRWGGDTGAFIIPAVDVVGLAGAVANDRYQIITAARAGNDSQTPDFRYWLAQPPEWGAVIGSSDRDELVPFFALDEHGDPVLGALESRWRTMSNGQAVRITGAFVEFVPRPHAVGDFDGGLPDDTECGFTITLVATGIVNYARQVTGPLKTGVSRTDPYPVAVRADSVADAEWPEVRGVWVPRRLDVEAQRWRWSITNLRHCAIRAVSVYGNTVPWTEG